MLKPEVKTLWVKALRSGEYEQGRGRLRSSDNKFCCLGVLCNLHAQAHPEFAAKQTNPTNYDGRESYLSVSVMEWAFKPDRLTRIENTYISLANMNDRGASFKTIAKFIEETL